MAAKKNYLFRLWINSLIWCSAFTTILLIFRYSTEDHPGRLLLKSFLVSLILLLSASTPLFLLSHFLYRCLPQATPLERLKSKRILSGVISLLAFLLPLLVDPVFFREGIAWIIAGCVQAGIWVATAATPINEVEDPGEFKDDPPPGK